jgi:TetR/AcrR family transcriptional regulator, cholesterol catabolism regulator
LSASASIPPTRDDRDRIAPTGGPSAAERILDAVVERMESDGVDALQLQDIPGRARVSMTTIYRAFPSRDELVVAAVARWMDRNIYRPLAEPDVDAPLFDSLVRYYRRLFEPWEAQPRMADAFVRARLSPVGHRLYLQGLEAATPVTRRLLEATDAAFADDVMMIMGNVVRGLFFRFAAGEIAVNEILPTIEQVLFRLTGSAEGPGAPGRAEPRGVAAARRVPCSN